MGAYSTISEGLAFGLWEDAWDGAYDRQRARRPAVGRGGGLKGSVRDREFRESMPPADPGGKKLPPAAKAAAKDLEALYVKINGGMSLKKLFEIDGGRDAGDFGYRLAVNALVSGGRHSEAKQAKVRKFDKLTSDIKRPFFLVMLTEHELTWEGGEDNEPGHVFARQELVNPDDARSLAETREILAGRTEKCHPKCQGWEVFETDTERGDEIQVCDECMSYLPKAKRLTDFDVEQLPEAQLALAKHGEAVDAAEREDVEREVRVISGGKVVPQGNPPRKHRFEGRVDAKTLALVGAADGWVQDGEQITFEPMELREGHHAWLYSGRDDQWHEVQLVGPSANHRGHWVFTGRYPGAEPGKRDAHESKFMARVTRKLRKAGHGR